jgi:hypothetical protein
MFKKSKRKADGSEPKAKATKDGGRGVAVRGGGGTAVVVALETVLEHEAGHSEFGAFLEQRFAREHLAIYDALRQLRHECTAARRAAQAQQIFDEFIAPDAPMQLMVEPGQLQHMHRGVRAALAAVPTLPPDADPLPPRLFDAVLLESTMTLRRNYLPDFLRALPSSNAALLHELHVAQLQRNASPSPLASALPSSASTYSLANLSTIPHSASMSNFAAEPPVVPRSTTTTALGSAPSPSTTPPPLLTPQHQPNNRVHSGDDQVASASASTTPTTADAVPQRLPALAMPALVVARASGTASAGTGGDGQVSPTSPVSTSPTSPKPPTSGEVSPLRRTRSTSVTTPPPLSPTSVSALPPPYAANASASASSASSRSYSNDVDTPSDDDEGDSTKLPNGSVSSSSLSSLSSSSLMALSSSLSSSCLTPPQGALALVRVYFTTMARSKVLALPANTNVCECKELIISKLILDEVGMHNMACCHQSHFTHSLTRQLLIDSLTH